MYKSIFTDSGIFIVVVCKYFFSENAWDVYKFSEKKNSGSKEENKKLEKCNKAGDSEENRKEEKWWKKIIRWWKKRRWPRKIVLLMLIIISVAFSSFFSYLFMFEKFVEGNLDLQLDNPIRREEEHESGIAELEGELDALDNQITEAEQSINDMEEGTDEYIDGLNNVNRLRN